MSTGAAVRQPAFLEWAGRGFTAELVRVRAWNDQGVQERYRGKRPADEAWQSLAVTPELVSEWARVNGANVGVRTRAFPAVDIDVDDPGIADACADLVLTELGSTSVRHRGNSPRRVLLYRLAGEPFKKSDVKFTAPNGTKHKVEFLAAGQQVVVAGRHQTGAALEWAPRPPAAADLPELTAGKRDALATKLRALLVELGCTVKGAAPPAKLVGHVSHQLSASDEDRDLADRALEGIDPDADYDEWLRVGMALHSKWPEAGGAGFALWDGWSSHGADYPGTAELEAKWRSFTPSGGVSFGTLLHMGGVSRVQAPRRGATTTTAPAQVGASTGTGITHELPRSDVGNAERFRRHAEGDFLFIAEAGTWFRWDGRRWQRDDLRGATQRAVEALRPLYAEAGDLPKAERQEVLRFVQSSERAERLRGMLSIAATDPTFARRIADFDRDLDTLNTAGGLVDLRTGKVIDTDRHRALVTRCAPASFDPDAEAPAFLRFLADVIPDSDVQDFLQRAAGYSLTGHTREQVLFFLHGGGRNGKSTFLELLRAAVGEGEYALAAAPELLLSNREARNTSDLADLRGARLVTTQEAGEGRSFDESRAKWLTGGDTINACRKYEHPFTFVPTHKLWIAANHKPKVRGTDEGFWRRICLVPFTVQIPIEQVDPRLKDKLMAELPGILAWAVRGAVEWHRRGLDAPEAVRAATREYRTAEDVLSAFVDDRCAVGGERQATLAALWEAYQAWTEGAGERRLSMRDLAAKLEERFTKSKGSAGVFFRGIGVRE